MWTVVIKTMLAFYGMQQQSCLMYNMLLLLGQQRSFIFLRQQRSHLSVQKRHMNHH
ncbi:hypothetical protein X975_12778, partial [Stegodyphus mimosarum]